jgi:hypothetical protein
MKVSLQICNLVGAAIFATLSTNAIAQQPACPKIDRPFIRNLPQSIAQSLQTGPIRSDICKDIDSALSAWAMRRVKGGRDAKPAQSVDVSKAEQELAKALANPEFVADWKQDQMNEAPGVRQQILLAGRLHEHHYFSARDLVLDRIESQ